MNKNNMRFKETLVSSDGGEKFSFLIGKNELKLILGMSQRLLAELPYGLESSQTKNRLRNLIKEINKVC